MPKKRVGVTLRKPSPAPEGSTAKDPAGEPDATPSPPPASSLDESSDSAGREQVAQAPDETSSVPCPRWNAAIPRQMAVVLFPTPPFWPISVTIMAPIEHETPGAA